MYITTRLDQHDCRKDEERSRNSRGRPYMHNIFRETRGRKKHSRKRKRTSIKGHHGHEASKENKKQIHPHPTFTKLRPATGSPAPPPISAQSRCHNRLLLQSPYFRRSVDCSRSHNILQMATFIGDSHITRMSCRDSETQLPLSVTRLTVLRGPAPVMLRVRMGVKYEANGER